MTNTDPPERIVDISTIWSDLARSQDLNDDSHRMAQLRTLDRYSAAIERYLIGAVGDPHVAADLYQEFALKFLRGSFQGARPERGRFRDYLVTTLSHIITDHRRKRARQLNQDSTQKMVLENLPAPTELEFCTILRTDILDRAMRNLRKYEKLSGRPLATVLEHRLKEPDQHSEEMAKALESALGRRVSAIWIRKQLHIARERFKDLVIQEVEELPGNGDLADELGDLGLLEFCQSGLQRHSKASRQKPSTEDME